MNDLDYKTTLNLMKEFDLKYGDLLENSCDGETNFTDVELNQLDSNFTNRVKASVFERIALEENDDKSQNVDPLQKMKTSDVVWLNCVVDEINQEDDLTIHSSEKSKTTWLKQATKDINITELYSKHSYFVKVGMYICTAIAIMIISFWGFVQNSDGFNKNESIVIPANDFQHNIVVVVKNVQEFSCNSTKDRFEKVLASYYWPYPLISKKHEELNATNKSSKILIRKSANISDCQNFTINLAEYDPNVRLYYIESRSFSLFDDLTFSDSNIPIEVSGPASYTFTQP